ncbi:hypothetical protein C8R45DRAFT_385791 [Mycena sanguinolenta]|nr:hypothetical protein C8R45DRAFT_385791 [Mycena sanguinolenta]
MRMQYSRGYLFWEMRGVIDGHSYSTETFSDCTSFQVLVGDMSRLMWVSRRGRFEVQSIGYSPVSAWDKEVDGGSNNAFIARFSHLGEDYATTVTEGADGVRAWNGEAWVEVQDYQVLCYKDF